MPDDPTPGRRYRLVSKATGHQLEVGNIREGEGANEIWHVKPGGQGWSWEVESADIGLRLKTGMALASSLSDAGDGTVGTHPVPGNNLVRLDSNLDRQVYVHRPNDGAFQKWRPIPDGEGFWQLVNVATGFALDGSDSDIFTMRPNDGAFQRWGFLPA